jgi:multidrug efflux pump subunit AcrB
VGRRSREDEKDRILRALDDPCRVDDFLADRRGRVGPEIVTFAVRAPDARRTAVEQLQNLQIRSPVAGTSIPIRRVVPDFERDFEDDILVRLHPLPTITVHADRISIQAARLFAKVRAEVEALELPPGYALE